MTAAIELNQEGLIDSDAVSRIQRLRAFGELIGNSDMHFGNLSFYLDDSLPFRVAPSYDMLPMQWAPGVQGEISSHALTPLPPIPSELAAWREAAGWAEDFWNRVAADPRLSADFVRLAAGAGATVRKLRGHFS